MFFRKLIIFLPLIIAIITSISACSAFEGSAAFVENLNGTEFTMDFKEWSSHRKFELSLEKGDVLQIEVVRENGKIGLAVSGKNGSEPYTSSNLHSGVFTVTVSEEDIYEIRLNGKKATGNVRVKKLESIDETKEE